MNHVNEINDLLEEMTDRVTEGNKNVLVPKLLKEALKVWQNYMSSKIKLNLTETDLQLHLKIMKRLWNLAEQYNPSEKVAFPVVSN